MIFDTHAHYDDEQFDADREELLGSLKEGGVDAVVNVGASLASSRAAVALAGRYSFMYAAAGVHPDHAAELDEESFSQLRELCRQEKVVAVGEIGLDYYWDESPRDVQKKWFIRQMELARELSLPVNIHSRDAAEDTLEIVREHGRDLPGVIHCFSYSKEIACAENGEEFNWFNTLGGGETFLDYVKNGALDYFGVTRDQGTQLYKNFDVQVFYSRYLDLGGVVAQPSQSREYTLYMGQAGDFTSYPTYSNLDPAEETAALVVHLLTEMNRLTGWNLDVAEINVGKDGVTISWAGTSALFVGPPEPQAEAFHVYDASQLAFTLLDSVQYSVQRLFAPKNPESLDVYFCGPDGGALALENLGVTLPIDQPYSHALLEGLLSGEN